jgi:hypothetical protein
MLTFDAFFNAWMTLAAVLVFLKIKKRVKWDWPVVLAPACVGVLLKLTSAFFNQA